MLDCCTLGTCTAVLLLTSRFVISSCLVASLMLRTFSRLVSSCTLRFNFASDSFSLQRKKEREIERERERERDDSVDSNVHTCTS